MSEVSDVHNVDVLVSPFVVCVLSDVFPCSRAHVHRLRQERLPWPQPGEAKSRRSHTWARRGSGLRPPPPSPQNSRGPCPAMGEVFGERVQVQSLSLRFQDRLRPRLRGHRGEGAGGHGGRRHWGGEGRRRGLRRGGRGVQESRGGGGAHAGIHHWDSEVEGPGHRHLHVSNICLFHESVDCVVCFEKLKLFVCIIGQFCSRHLIDICSLSVAQHHRQRGVRRQGSPEQAPREGGRGAGAGEAQGERDDLPGGRSDGVLVLREQWGE